MSILVSRKPQLHEQTTEMLQPNEQNIWTAGDPTPVSNVAAPVAAEIVSTGVRSAHQGGHHGQSVQAYMKFKANPLGMSNMAADTKESANAAIEELSQYALNLTKPMLCTRVTGSTDDAKVYESSCAYAPIASVENIANNMREHGVCIQCTISDPILSFQPFSVKLTAEDLHNCISHAQPVVAGGCESKFIKTVSHVAPHSVLFHIVKNPNTQQHFFYGLNFTEKNTF